MPGWFKLGEAKSPLWRGRPTQMLNVDVPTWWKYVDSPRSPIYEEIYYNVAMTTVEPSTIDGPKPMVDMWLYNVSKRVDAMCIWQNEVHIIEVTDRAGLRSLGQIISYVFLYDYTKPFTLPRTPIIVCENADPDVKMVALDAGIEIIENTPIELFHIIQEALAP